MEKQQKKTNLFLLFLSMAWLLISAFISKDYFFAGDKISFCKVMIIMGQAVFFFVLLYLLATHQKFNFWHVLFMGGGLFLFVIGCFQLSTNTELNAISSKILEHIVDLIFIGLFAILGVVMLLIGLRTILKMSRCTMSINAECIKVKESIRRGGGDYASRTYSPIWKCNYNDKEIILESSSYTSKMYNVGDKQNILINPNNTNEFIDNTQKVTGPMFTIGGILFVCVAIIFIFSFF